MYALPVEGSYSYAVKVFKGAWGCFFQKAPPQNNTSSNQSPRKGIEVPEAVVLEDEAEADG